MEFLLQGSNVYASHRWGYSISSNGGTSYTNYTTANGLGNNQVRGSYASGSAIYVATTGGVSISTDGGASYTNYTSGLDLLQYTESFCNNVFLS